MAFDFPATPTLNQVFTPPSGSPTYIWNGSVWLVNSTTPIGFMWWPAGMGIDFWGSTAPAGSRLCYGQLLLRADYPALFAAIGVAFATGGEAGTEFRLPDARGRSMAGKDDMGGTDAGRLSGIGATVLGASGGTQTETLSGGHLPSHTHTQGGTFGTGGFTTNHWHTFVSPGNNSGNNYQSGNGWNIAVTYNGTTNAADRDHAHYVTISGETAGGPGSSAPINNIQPTIICNKLITTGGVA